MKNKLILKEIFIYNILKKEFKLKDSNFIFFKNVPDLQAS